MFLVWTTKQTSFWLVYCKIPLGLVHFKYIYSRGLLVEGAYNGEGFCVSIGVLRLVKSKNINIIVKNDLSSIQKHLHFALTPI